MSEIIVSPIPQTVLDCWRQEANTSTAKLGAFNWPLVVRSLIAEIDRLKAATQ